MTINGRIRYRSNERKSIGIKNIAFVVLFMLFCVMLTLIMSGYIKDMEREEYEPPVMVYPVHGTEKIETHLDSAEEAGALFRIRLQNETENDLYSILNEIEAYRDSENAKTHEKKPGKRAVSIEGKQKNGERLSFSLKDLQTLFRTTHMQYFDTVYIQNIESKEETMKNIVENISHRSGIAGMLDKVQNGFVQKTTIENISHLVLADVTEEATISIFNAGYFNSLATLEIIAGNMQDTSVLEKLKAPFLEHLMLSQTSAMQKIDFDLFTRFEGLKSLGLVHMKKSVELSFERWALQTLCSRLKETLSLDWWVFSKMANMAAFNRKLVLWEKKKDLERAPIQISTRSLYLMNVEEPDIARDNLSGVKKGLAIETQSLNVVTKEAPHHGTDEEKRTREWIRSLPIMAQTFSLNVKKEDSEGNMRTEMVSQISELPDEIEKTNIISYGWGYVKYNVGSGVRWVERKAGRMMGKVVVYWYEREAERMFREAVRRSVIELEAYFGTLAIEILRIELQKVLEKIINEQFCSIEISIPKAMKEGYLEELVGMLKRVSAKVLKEELEHQRWQRTHIL